MQPSPPDVADAPEPQALMAAVIRLTAKCACRPDVMGIRTLLALLAQLRGHPGLSRQPAVLAGLAEAHALWVERLGEVSLAENCLALAGARGEDGCQRH